MIFILKRPSLWAGKRLLGFVRRNLFDGPRHIICIERRRRDCVIRAKSVIQCGRWCIVRRSDVIGGTVLGIFLDSLMKIRLWC